MDRFQQLHLGEKEKQSKIKHYNSKHNSSNAYLTEIVVPTCASSKLHFHFYIGFDATLIYVIVFGIIYLIFV
jgi:hypothetical protein